MVLALFIGFPVALILAWAFELTPEGIKRAQDVDPTQASADRSGHKMGPRTINDRRRHSYYHRDASSLASPVRELTSLFRRSPGTIVVVARFPDQRPVRTR